MRDIAFIKEEFLSLQVPINIHYLDRYIKFIIALPEMVNGYGERHHILPQCMFPQYKSKSLSPWNQKKIDARAHYLCHWLLWKAFPGSNKMSSAFWGMSVMQKGDRQYKINSTAYSKVRIEHRDAASKNMTGRTNSGRPGWRKAYSQDIIDNWRLAGSLYDWYRTQDLTHGKAGAYALAQRACKQMGFEFQYSFVNMFIKFKSGWIPHNDVDWLDFSNS